LGEAAVIINGFGLVGAFGGKESRQVLQLVQALRASSVSVILVSHNIEHVFEVSDRVTVLRRGQVGTALTTRSTSPEEIVRFITGATGTVRNEVDRST
jgi:ABC-type sugar transport system ATPase subunit